MKAEEKVTAIHKIKQEKKQEKGGAIDRDTSKSINKAPRYDMYIGARGYTNVRTRG